MHRVRGSGHRGKGRRHQAAHRAGQPPSLPGRGTACSQRPRTLADVHATLRPPPARRRRGRDLRSKLVQPRRGRAGHGVLHRRGVGPVPPARSHRRAGHRRLRSDPAQVLARGQPGGADASPDRSHRRWPQDLEALGDGPRVLRPLVRLLQGARRHVRRHRYRDGALVRGQLRRQAPGPPQHHQPHPRPGPLRTRGAGARCPAATAEEGRLPRAAARTATRCRCGSDPFSEGDT